MRERAGTGPKHEQQGLPGRAMACWPAVAKLERIPTVATTELMERPGQGRSLEKARSARRRNPSGAITDGSAQNRLSKLDPTRRAFVEERLSQMPPTCRNNYLKAVSGKSPAAGIKAFCMECVGWDRGEVAACTALACPLYAYRPFKGESASKRRACPPGVCAARG